MTPQERATILAYACQALGEGSEVPIADVTYTDFNDHVMNWFDGLSSDRAGETRLHGFVVVQRISYDCRRWLTVRGPTGVMVVYQRSKFPQIDYGAKREAVLAAALAYVDAYRKTYDADSPKVHEAQSNLEFAVDELRKPS